MIISYKNWRKNKIMSQNFSNRMKYVENMWETGQKKYSYKKIKEKIKYDKIKALISKKKKTKFKRKSSMRLKREISFKKLMKNRGKSFKFSQERSHMWMIV